MCHSIKTIAKVKSGELCICEDCKIYHLEFNNIYFEFTHKQFLKFKQNLMALEVEYWEHKYACSKMERKIPIPSLQENLVLMFNRQEIVELKTLFSMNSNEYNKLLNVGEIDYMLIIN